MPLFGTYYIDGASLSSATAVFADALMTTPAPDGFYSDGSIVRQQIGGLLSIIQTCPSCSLGCDTAISASGGTGIYRTPYNLNSNTGCVIIYFNALNIPAGIRVEYNGVLYNKLTSIIYGYLASSASPNNYTFVGDSSFDCGIAAALSGGGYSGLNEYAWDIATSNYSLVGTAGVVTGAAGDVQLTANPSGFCTMRIPKFAPSPIDLLVEVVGPCATADFQLEVNCPVLLTGVPTSDSYPVGSDSLTLCNTVGEYPNTYYNVPNYGGVAGCPALHEFYVQDPFGNLKVPAGKYKIPASACIDGDPKILTVDSNGVIVDVFDCPI